MDDRDLDDAIAAVAALDDLKPDDVGPHVAAIYEEIKQTLRVPVVNFVFRAAANEPDWLACAWAAVRPTAGSVRFEDEADSLRAVAAAEPPAVDAAAVEALGDDVDTVRAYVATIHYVLPKLLLIASGWQAALAGDRAAAPDGPGGQLPLGVAPGTTNVPMVEPDEAAEPVRELLQDIARHHGHPAPATFYRGLANWPDFLGPLWQALRERVAGPAYRDLRTAVIGDADHRARALGLPAAVDCGVPREDWPSIVSVFRLRLLPDLMLVSAMVRDILDGPAAGASSPFSAARSD